MRRLPALLLVALWVSPASAMGQVEAGPGTARSQAGLSTPAIAAARLDTLATFTAASSLSTGLGGTLWIADRGAGHLVKLAPDGTRTRVGLPGGRPSAVDASAGLRVLVANELRGTIDVLGLSGDLLMRLRIPANAEEDFASNPEFLAGRADAAERSSGTPGDVVRMPAGGVVAVESTAGFLVYWDQSGRAQRIVAEAAGSRIQPVNIERIASGIVVTEPARNRVLFFDAFGTFGGQEPLPGSPLSVAAYDDGIWVATRGHLICLNPAVLPRTARTCPAGRAMVANPAADGIVDLVVSRDAFYLLTPRALLRLPRESGDR